MDSPHLHSMTTHEIHFNLINPVATLKQAMASRMSKKLKLKKNGWPKKYNAISSRATIMAGLSKKSRKLGSQGQRPHLKRLISTMRIIRFCSA